MNQSAGELLWVLLQSLSSKSTCRLLNFLGFSNDFFFKGAICKTQAESRVKNMQ